MKKKSNYNFQVNLGGIIELFSQHLYSSPKVFVRELLQNAVDAITARHLKDSAAPREITVTLTDNPKTVRVKDTGTGLTLEEIHRFLSIIGESSKRAAEETGDFIGRFGIGLLSGFLVSNTLELYTKSKGGKGYLWRASEDGTYAIEEAKVEEIGSTVVLTCKEGFEEYFEAENLSCLLSYYGDILPYKINFTTENNSATINENIPPWLTPNFSTPDDIMKWGEGYFGERFMGYIPLKSEKGGLDGVAYIMDRRVNPAHKMNHRVYLRNMLLSETGEGLLPSWAFFVRAVVNAQNLRPTASREDFYEDELLESTREELGNTIKARIKEMAEKDPQALERFIAEHSLALKSIAIDDEEILRTFLDYFTFETSLGYYSFKEIRELVDVVRYVPTLDEFRQVAPVFGARGSLLLNAGYVYEAELMEAIPLFIEELAIEKLSPEDALFEMDELTPDESDRFFDFQRELTAHLKKWGVAAEMKSFAPVELPALILISERASFIQDLRYSKERSTDVFSNILDQIDQNVPHSETILCFNAQNMLVKKLATKGLKDGTVVDLLYAQSLLLARRPLKMKEMAALNGGILKLIEQAL